MGTPIIVQPQVAILAIGTIKKVAAVVEGKNGDEIKIRNKVFLSHTYDHRIVDGALGGKFVKKVAYYIENFEICKVWQIDRSAPKLCSYLLPGELF